MQGIENIFEIKDWQLKTILFVYRLLYKNLRVTTNWKSTIGTHIKKELKKKKKKTRQSWATNHRRTKQEMKRKDIQNKSITFNKMAVKTNHWSLP